MLWKKKKLFSQKFESIPETERWKTLCELLLAGTIYLPEPEYLLKLISGKSHSEKLKQQALYITRTPEFQLV
jgi:hypothetical protein